jgi:cysteinyl-tRNA synthetase
MLQIHNTVSRKKEPFTPLVPGKVGIYVCGMTVYDRCHVGHARVMLVFDVVVRYLRYRGYQVTYVRNITDIDDKIIQRARESGEEIVRLTDRYIRLMHEDAERLGLLAPDHEPRATAHLDQILAMIQVLLDKGYAYRADNGDVYYDVSRFPRYGRLSGRNPEDLRAGARVEIGESKEDPLDFALWKAAKPGEPVWDSPWGQGRPGWHIECSAMSTACLGAHFDIHGGGQDLQFPHHENEIAQSEGATGEPFVSLWMHNGFVRVDDEKMSKSLGNFFTLEEVFQRYHPEVVRNFILTSHYRSPLNYSDQNLAQARADLDKLYFALRGLGRIEGKPDPGFARRFEAAMDDDFNTPEARAVLAELAGEINRARDAGDRQRAGVLGHTLVELAGVLGLAQHDPEAYFQQAPQARAATGDIGQRPEVTAAEIDTLIRRRAEARKSRNFGAADRIRDELEAMGVELQDGPQGTTWRWK